jgi:hypothetical protein
MNSARVGSAHSCAHAANTVKTTTNQQQQQQQQQQQRVGMGVHAVVSKQGYATSNVASQKRGLAVMQKPKLCGGYSTKIVSASNKIYHRAERVVLA